MKKNTHKLVLACVKYNFIAFDCSILVIFYNLLTIKLKLLYI